MLFVLPGECGGYFAVTTATLGLSDAQVETLKKQDDIALLDFVNSVALSAYEKLSRLDPAGSC